MTASSAYPAHPKCSTQRKSRPPSRQHKPRKTEDSALLLKADPKREAALDELFKQVQEEDPEFEMPNGVWIY